MTDKKCKICRRAGEKLFLKGERCFTPKCAFVERPYAPGKLDSERKHRSGVSEYGDQLKEKQKIRNVYGVSEKQFFAYVKLAINKKIEGLTPIESLMQYLESRVDNVVYRMGLVSSRALARQVVSHGHITVNGKKLTIPSYKVKVGDVIAIREGSKGAKLFAQAGESISKQKSNWLKLDSSNLSATVASLPRAVEHSFDVQKVLEFYSR